MRHLQSNQQNAPGARDQYLSVTIRTFIKVHVGMLFASLRNASLWHCVNVNVFGPKLSFTFFASTIFRNCSYETSVDRSSRVSPMFVRETPLSGIPKSKAAASNFSHSFLSFSYLGFVVSDSITITITCGFDGTLPGYEYNAVNATP